MGRIFLLCCCFWLSACTVTSPEVKVVEVNTTEPLPEIDGSLFAAVDDAIQPEDIFALTAAQEKAFLDYYHAPHNQDIAPHKRLAYYLEEILYGFDYKGDTYTAAVALDKFQGNCMSLAMVTSALAKLVGLKVEYQKVERLPVYRKEGGLLMLSGHVRTHVMDPDYVKEPDVLVLTYPSVIIDYFPAHGDFNGGRVTEAGFIALFYQNLAADALINADYDRAFAYIRHAIAAEPFDAENLNMLAILYRRVGDEKSAETFYQYGIKHTEGSLNLVSNYQLLLSGQGRTQEADVLKARLLDVEDNNPYNWIKLATEKFQQDELRLAEMYYNKAVEIAPYLEEAYLGLAKTYHQRGMMMKTRQALRKAIELSYTPEDQRRYMAKLSSLSPTK